MVSFGDGAAPGNSRHRWPRFDGRLLGYLRSLRTSGPADRTVVSMVLLAGGNIEAEKKRYGQRHVLLCADRAVQSALISAAFGEREKEKKHMMCSLASFAF